MHNSIVFGMTHSRTFCYKVPCDQFILWHSTSIWVSGKTCLNPTPTYILFFVPSTLATPTLLRAIPFDHWSLRVILRTVAGTPRRSVPWPVEPATSLLSIPNWASVETPSRFLPVLQAVPDCPRVHDTNLLTTRFQLARQPRWVHL